MFLYRHRFILFALLLPLLVLGALSLPAAGRDGGLDASRAKLVSYLVRDQLAQHHYSHKPLDDTLSLAAFDLYLKQLDAQKRFLLQADVARLRGYAARIDDEMTLGRFELPLAGATVLRERTAQARQMVEEILAGEFDFTQRESFEADPEKLGFCATPAELRERWRLSLKYQVLSRYLGLLEDEGLLPKSGVRISAPKKGKEAELLALAKEKVLKSHRDFFARLQEESDQDHYDRYFDAVARAYDPHTNYLPPQQKEDFDIGMRGSLEGIGATLREEDGYIKVVSIIPGSPAARQGQLHAEDVILMVAQGSGEPVEVTDTRLRDAVSLIRGPKGTEVRLTVRKPDGTRVVIPIVRDVVQIEETFVKSAVIGGPGGRSFGYIKVPSFYRDFQKTRDGGAARNVTDDVRAELEKLTAKKVDGVILDLRNNGGGALTDAVDVTGLFIEKGPVVQIKNSSGRIETLADEDPSVVYAGPLLVQVNEFSASASEIVAGALQDYGRAVIVGSDHTHGKGTVQAVVDLDRSLPFSNMERYKPLGAMRVTIQKFYRVSGASTQFRGVVPDIVLPDRMGHLKTGEQYLDHALPWDTVAATTFVPWMSKPASLAGLKAKSSRRVGADPGFVDIARDQRQAAARMEKTVQSLQIDDVLREREEAKRLLSEEEAGIEGDGEGAGKAEESAEERQRRWLKEVGEDPYNLEAMNILADALGSSAVAAGAQAEPAPDRTPYSRGRLP
jgi:carboxyl-terminal processing protease